MKRPCCCGHCPRCAAWDRDEDRRHLAACERMRKARKAEPPEHATSQSSLGPGRPLRNIYTRAMGAVPGGEQ